MRSLMTCLIVLVAATVTWADTKEQTARTDIKNLTLALNVYQIKRGNFPAELADLKTSGIVDPKTLFVDPWGNPYHYDAKGKRNGGKRPDVWAVTPDQKEIGNWSENQKK